MGHAKKTEAAFLHYCGCVAEQIVERRWAGVEAVAEALAARKTLTHGEVHALLKSLTAVPAKLRLRAKKPSPAARRGPRTRRTA